MNRLTDLLSRVFTYFREYVEKLLVSWEQRKKTNIADSFVRSKKQEMHADIAVTIADHGVRLLHGRHDNPDAEQIVLEDL